MSEPMRRNPGPDPAADGDSAALFLAPVPRGAVDRMIPARASCCVWRGPSEPTFGSTAKAFMFSALACLLTLIGRAPGPVTRCADALRCSSGFAALGFSYR